jgi:hypothetical protein
MSLILTNEVASALYRSLMEVNNLDSSRFETTFKTRINESFEVTPVTFKYVEHFGIRIDADAGPVEYYKTQHDFAVAYGFAS